MYPTHVGWKNLEEMSGGLPILRDEALISVCGPSLSQLVAAGMARENQLLDLPDPPDNISIYSQAQNHWNRDRGGSGFHRLRAADVVRRREDGEKPRASRRGKYLHAALLLLRGVPRNLRYFGTKRMARLPLLEDEPKRCLPASRSDP
jgi:hypothetical protein